MVMQSITSRVVPSLRNPGGGCSNNESRCGMDPARRYENDSRSSSGDFPAAEVDEDSFWPGLGVEFNRISLNRGPTMGGPVSVYHINRR